MEEKISVIIPVYKAEEFLTRCLESILTQTYNNLEIILIDDGSPDNSGKICDEYAKKDKRIKVIHKQNEGVSVARNIGIENSTGKYITFIDSDDWIDKYAYEKMLEQMKKNNVDVVKCGFFKDFEEMPFIYPESKKIDLDVNREEVIQLFTTGRALAGMCYLLIKKTCIDKIDKFNSKLALGEDLLFELELMCTAGSIYMFNDRFYHYFTNIGSATKSMNYKKRNIEQLMILYENVCNLLREYDLLDNKKKEDFAFYCFYNIYLQLAKYVSFTKKKDDVEEIIENKAIDLILCNLNISNLSIVAKLFYYLIKNKQTKFLYYFCLVFNWMKEKN